MQARFCPQCGAPRGAGDRFCRGCGRDLSEAPPPDGVRSFPAAASDVPPRSVPPLLAIGVVLILLVVAVSGGLLVSSAMRPRPTAAPLAVVATPTALLALSPAPAPAAPSVAPYVLPPVSLPPLPAVTPASVASIKLVSARATAVGYQIMIAAQFKNLGPDLVALGDGAAYILYATDGSLITSGTFLLPLPQVIAAGQSAYYFDTYVVTEGSVSVGRVEVTPPRLYSATDLGPPITLSDVSVGSDAYGVTVDVKGIAINGGSDDLQNVVVGIIFFDRNGRPIGGAVDNVATPVIGGGQRRGFQMLAASVLPVGVLNMAASHKLIAYNWSPLP